MKGYFVNIINEFKTLDIDKSIESTVFDVTTSTERKHKTKKSIVFNESAGINLKSVSGNLKIDINKKYMLSAYVYGEEVDNAIISCRYYTGNIPHSITDLSIQEENSEKWMRMVGIFTIPTEYDKIQIVVEKSNKGAVYIDGITCYCLDQLSEYGLDTDNIELMSQYLPYFPDNKNVSNATYVFENQIPVKISIQTMLKNGSKLTIENEDIETDNFNIQFDWGDSFPIGAITTKSLQFDINNLDGKFNNIDFEKATLKLDVEYYDEYLEIYSELSGIFSEHYVANNVINKNGYLSFECTAYSIAQIKKAWQDKSKEYVHLDDLIEQAKTRLNINIFNEIDNYTPELDKYFVLSAEKMYNNYTFLQMLQMYAITQNAYIDFVDGTDVVLRSIRTINTANPKNHTHQFYDVWNNLSYSKEIRVSGAKFTKINDNGNNDTEYATGTDEYSIDISGGTANYRMIVATQPQAFIDTLGRFFIGSKLTPFSMDVGLNLFVNCGDLISFVDYNGNIQYSMVTAVEIDFNGYTTISCRIPVPDDNSANYDSASTQLANELNADVITTNWVSLTLSSNFKLNNVNEPVQARRIGKNVYVRGAINNINEMTVSTDVIKIATLPADCVPSRNCQFVCHGSAAYTWLCTVARDGNIYMSRYGVAGSYVTMIANTWLAFNLSYCID